MARWGVPCSALIETPFVTVALSSSSAVCASRLSWYGMVISAPMATNTASKMWKGRRVRRPCLSTAWGPVPPSVRSSGNFSPIGQLSSLLSGSRSMSTSSISMTPLWKSASVRLHTLTSAAFLCSSCKLSLSSNIGAAAPPSIQAGNQLVSVVVVPRALASSSISSSTCFSSRLFSDVGAATTTACRSQAVASLLYNCSFTGESRAKLSVITGLGSTGDENASVSTPRDISSRAAGMQAHTSLCPFARYSTSRGAMTVVLPAPMIIWWHSDSPASAFDRNLPTVSTWDFRSIMLLRNSKTSKRGS
mmetsp:Transcript_51559/g.147223  ORF Transcript_51559/g.147223 Transcript_51559/m.147223 type:complete len:305 (-) Transcript_51559:269-1183(-)